MWVLFWCGVLFYFFFCVDFFSHARERPSRSVEHDSSLVLGCHPRFPWHVDGRQRQRGKKKREEGGWRAVEVKIRSRYLCELFFCLFTLNETRILRFFFSFLEIIDLYTKDKTLEPLSVFIAITYNSTTPPPPFSMIRIHNKGSSDSIAPVTMSAPFCFWCGDLDNCDGNYNKWPLYFKVRRPSLSKSIWVTINLIIP